MKKILILCLACVSATMLCAAPQSQLPVVKQTTNNIRPQVLHELMQDLSKRPAPAAESIQRAPHRIAPAAKAPAEYIDLYCDGFLVGPEYEYETREWYIALGAQGYTFRLCWYGEPDTYCGTVFFEDISWDYTWGWYQSSDLFYEIYPSDITMTISEKNVGSLKQIILEAEITDQDDKIYRVHAVHNIYTPKEELETVLSNTVLTMGSGQYILDGNDANLDVVLAVNSDMVEGAYDNSHLDMSQTKITYKGVQQQLLQSNLLVEPGFLPNGSMGYNVSFSFINQDTILHHVTMPASLPAAKDTIQVSCINLEMDDSFAPYGILMAMGSNKDYDIMAMFGGEYLEAGVYTDAAITITDKTTWLSEQSISAILTLAEAENGWQVNIEAYASDYNHYSIDMKFEVPVPTDTVKVSFKNSAMATYLQDQYDMLQLLSVSRDWEASVTVYGVKPGESFGMENIVLDYCGIYDWSIESTVAIADIKGVLNQRGDTTLINASVIGFNAIQYDVELWYTAPTPTDTVEITMPMKFTNALDFGYYTLSAYTPDSLWFISLSPIADKVAGEFINDGMFGRFGAQGGRYDFYAGSTFIYSEDEWQNYTIEKGSMTVQHAADGTITAEAKFVAKNAIHYHITITSEYNTHLDYDEPEIEIDRAYTTDDEVFIENQIDPNGYIYLSITAADQSDMCAFFFYAEEADEDIIIPTGVYPIDYSEEYGTVQANPGVQGNGVLPSFYAEISGDGSLVVPIWLLVDGTVEVTKDEDGNPHLEVNAFNSYGVPVHITYDGSFTSGVENITGETHATKRIENGQILIQRNGNTYNVLGAQIQ